MPDYGTRYQSECHPRHTYSFVYMTMKKVIVCDNGTGVGHCLSV